VHSRLLWRLRDVAPISSEPLNMNSRRGCGLPLCVENGLRVSFLDCGQLLRPRLRRAEPKLIFRDQLIPLANRTDIADHPL
jgi:hypothetical protein